ncbi:MAG: response regulator [Spirochaetia bacterium]|nr:response regulator [Spirochaetia bacterium]
MLIFAGFYWAAGILERHLRAASEETANTIEAKIRGGFSEAELLLDNCYTRVQKQLNREAPQEAILTLLTDITDWMGQLRTTILTYYGVYGYIREKFIDSIDMNPGNDFIPQMMPWYEVVAGKGKEVVYTPRYVDAKTGDFIISLARNIYDSDGVYCGILTMDVELSRLSEYVRTLHSETGSYGVLLNQHLTVLSHPRKEFEGRQLLQLKTEADYAHLSELLQKKETLHGFKITNSDDVPVIIFGRRLFNDWYIAFCTPVETYYAQVYRTAWHLSILAMVLVVSLSIIIIRISAAQIKADDMNRHKSSFLARMSHEMRTPLNAIIGMSELALRADNTPKVTEYVDGIKMAGYNLLSLINDILDISRIEAGSLQMPLVSYTLSSLINDVINVIRAQTAEKPITFCVNADGAIPNHLEGDQTRVRQILTNLLSNAAKYTYEGFIRFDVRFAWRDARRIVLVFEVADSGIGIKPENLKSLFTNFARFDQERNRDVEGSGLGLAIARSTCRAMGGDILVSSEYGKGSVFTATIIQTVTNDQALAKVENPSQKRVLCYEPNPFSADSLRKNFENLGVPARMMKSKDEFFLELKGNPPVFAFAPPDMAEDMLHLIRENALPLVPVALARRGETPSAQNDSTILTPPAWAVPMANTLNYQCQLPERIRQKRISFIMPEARILAVDDLKTNLQVIAGFLSLYEARMDSAASGMEAVTLVKNNKYDLVFMDQMMPGMDGAQATAVIRSLNGEYYRNLPIIALTANAMPGIDKLLRQKGMSDYLSKPIEIANLDKILKQWIPPSKQQNTGASADQDTPAILDGYAVEGIDFPMGRMRYGDDEAYLKILRSYVSEISALRGKLSGVTQETLGEYAILIHGIKGSCSSVCAGELGQKAFELEKAAKAGNIAFVQEANEAFCARMETTLKNLKTVLDSIGEPGQEKRKMPAPDAKLLRALLEACGQYNFSEMDKILHDLESCDYDRDAPLIRWLREQTNGLEYESIQERLEKFLAGDHPS